VRPEKAPPWVRHPSRNGLLRLAPPAFQALLRLPLGVELEHRARGRGTAHEVRCGDLSRAFFLEFGENRAARVRRNGGNRAGARAEAEPMQCQCSLRLWISSHVRCYGLRRRRF
jgi:hypothetical protein